MDLKTHKVATSRNVRCHCEDRLMITNNRESITSFKLTKQRNKYKDFFH